MYVYFLTKFLESSSIGFYEKDVLDDFGIQKSKLSVCNLFKTVQKTAKMEIKYKSIANSAMRNKTMSCIKQKSFK